jgi:hypothetical protein
MAEEAEVERCTAAGAKMIEIIKPYADRGKIYEKIRHAESLGLLDEPCRELRRAVYAVAEGTMSVDEAVESFGKLEG